MFLTVLTPPFTDRHPPSAEESLSLSLSLDGSCHGLLQGKHDHERGKEAAEENGQNEDPGETMSNASLKTAACGLWCGEVKGEVAFLLLVDSCY